MKVLQTIKRLSVYRSAIILFLLISPAHSFSQTLMENISAEICGCLDTQNDSTISSSFGQCFSISVGNHEEKVKESLQNSSEECKEKNAKEVFEQFMLNLTEEMIYSCDEYFQWIENLKLATFIVNNPDSIQLAILNHTQKLKNEPGNELVLLSRGHQYLRLKDFKNAGNDFKQILKINDENALALLYLGMTYEYSGKLKKAVDYYSKFNDLTDNSPIKAFKFTAIKKLNL